MNKDYAGGQSEKIATFVRQVFQPEDLVLREIRKRSTAKGLPEIQVGEMDGLHLEVLTRAIGAKKAVEIGTLGGYSGVCIARGMGPGSKLYTFDADKNHIAVAEESFARAGLKDCAEVFVGPAIKNLPLIEKHGPFDLVFIDADKENYPNYLKWAGEHLKVGGVLLADNTFAFGMLADETFENAEDATTVRSIRLFNEAAARGGRFRATILPTGEGLTMAVKIK